MTPTSALLRSLDAISSETTAMLDVLERDRSIIPAADFREAKRRALELRGKTQELFDWLAIARLEEPRN